METLLRMVSEGTAVASDLVWTEGMGTWKPLLQVVPPMPPPLPPPQEMPDPMANEVSFAGMPPLPHSVPPPPIPKPQVVEPTTPANIVKPGPPKQKKSGSPFLVRLLWITSFFGLGALIIYFVGPQEDYSAIYTPTWRKVFLVDAESPFGGTVKGSKTETVEGEKQFGEKTYWVIVDKLSMPGRKEISSTIYSRRGSDGIYVIANTYLGTEYLDSPVPVELKASHNRFESRLLSWTAGSPDHEHYEAVQLEPYEVGSLKGECLKLLVKGNNFTGWTCDAPEIGSVRGKGRLDDGFLGMSYTYTLQEFHR